MTKHNVIVNRRSKVSSTSGSRYKLTNANSTNTEVNFDAKRLANLKNKISLIDSYELLPPGWNGAGSEKIEKLIIDKVKNIVLSLKNILPKIFPTGRNSIQLEYKKKNGDYLEFEIFEDRIEGLKIVGEQEEEFEIKDSQIQDKIIEFYDK